MTARRPVAALRLVGVDVELGGRPVLEGVDLVVEAGVPTAVTGPSGAGKTVLCLLLAGVLAPTRGRLERVMADGTGAHKVDDAAWPPEAAAGTRAPDVPVGLVLQHHGLLDGLTAEENAALPLQARRLPAGEVAWRARRALVSVGLGEHLDRAVDELSGGERQRVAIARALAGDPAVLVADEPTAELDPENRQRVLDLLLAEHDPPRVVVVASDDAEVVGACRRVVELEAGRVARIVPVSRVGRPAPG